MPTSADFLTRSEAVEELAEAIEGRGHWIIVPDPRFLFHVGAVLADVASVVYMDNGTAPIMRTNNPRVLVLVSTVSGVFGVAPEDEFTAAVIVLDKEQVAVEQLSELFGTEFPVGGEQDIIFLGGGRGMLATLIVDALAETDPHIWAAIDLHNRSN